MENHKFTKEENKKGKKRKMKLQDRQKKSNRMTLVSLYLSTIILNVNGLKSPIKRHRVPGWMKKQDPIICCLQETHISFKDTHRINVKGWKHIFHASGNQKKDQ